MEDEPEFYEAGLEEHPKSTIIFGNLVMLIWFALGAISCWFFSPLIAWIYLAFAIIMVGIVLRKIVCTNCYYYGKWCHIGWGKLSACFFRKGDIRKFKNSIGIKIAPIIYGLLTLIPIVFIVIAMIQKFTIFKLIILILLILVFFYSGFVSRKKSCEGCKMRLMCSGSVAKEK